ncbi:unnamed protein product [Protopolystoma xenopodis]|uniref:Uncharacterized protein n=1 Tax=Protopolystoma xenopodis TaxID=117903 RepID=A0A3S4ZB60_9PLAT|nr:unnamed protein product [Protopolystoma xenopodis]
MAPLTDDAGETFGNVPNQWSNAGNHEAFELLRKWDDGRRQRDLRFSRRCPPIAGFKNSSQGRIVMMRCAVVTVPIGGQETCRPTQKQETVGKVLEHMTNTGTG